jgi:hypothetical protein
LSEQPTGSNSQGGYEPDELEVTPEMIAAGVAALRGFDPALDDAYEVTRSVLKAALGKAL